MKTIIITFLVCLLIITGGLIYLFEPYIELNRERKSLKPIEIKVKYINVTGDGSCAKLYRLIQKNDQKEQLTHEPVFIALPLNMLSPEESVFAYSDNVFILKGYEYVWVEKNLFTGNRRQFPAARFDVIRWQLVPPYQKWISTDTETGSVAYTQSNEPVIQEYSSSDHSPNHFRFPNYIDCLK